MDGRRLVELAESEELQADWTASHADAAVHGVFGTPTYVFKGERFWGQELAVGEFVIEFPPPSARPQP
jgi:2-hydroxychromene-2-carboxylate isomerase